MSVQIWIGNKVVSALLCSSKVSGWDSFLFGQGVGYDNSFLSVEEVENPVLNSAAPPAQLIDPVFQEVSVRTSKSVAAFC